MINHLYYLICSRLSNREEKRECPSLEELHVEVGRQRESTHKDIIIINWLVQWHSYIRRIMETDDKC